MFVEGFAKRDTITEDRRLFRNTLTVRILSEMTEATAQNAMQLVQSVNINTNTNSIPSDYTPLSLTVVTQ